jgi:hypothetical protein
MGKACKEIREDTDKQMHAICSMVEDIAKIASQTEFVLGSKVPLIDNFYKNMSEMNLKVEENERLFKQQLNELK